MSINDNKPKTIDIYNYGRKYIRKNNINIPKKSIGKLHYSSHPHYIIGYYTYHDDFIRTINFDYPSTECNTEFKSIW